MTTPARRSIAAMIITLGLIALTACGGGTGTSTTAGAANTGSSASGASGVGCVHTAPGTPAAPKTYASAPPMTISTAKTYTATMTTSCGTIVIRLEPKQAPVTANNFVFLADQGFYNGLTFHRVIRQFIIQGGDPAGNGTGGPGYQFNDELPTTAYRIGDLAMANAGPNTNGSQFFIVEGSPTHLALAYSRFGVVTSGLNVVDRIANVPSDPTTNKPNQTVWIYSVKISVGR